MFNNNFFPTPAAVIEIMMQGEDIKGKVFLEPSAGKGDIIDYLTDNGAKSVISCEIESELREILKTKSIVICDDFLTLTSDKISHIDYIVMNPPFSADDSHILHAYEIAPAGCNIIALCNYATIENPYSAKRKQLLSLVNNLGSVISLGDCFATAERKTSVNIGLIKLQKAGAKEKDEFNGFFEEEDAEERQEDSIMTYNVIRDIVNRYVQACKIYAEILNVKTRLNNVTGSFFGGDIGVQLSLTYDQYKKELQKSGWYHILNKMELTKFTTSGVTADINKFVEQQTQIPFTMRNIYHMLDIIHQTAGQRMDKAILEAFERVTSHHHENRHHVKGWKTNSHFLVGKKFILPNQISPAKSYGYTSTYYTSLSSSYRGTVEDLEKALCFVTGEKYEEMEWTNGTRRNKGGITTINTSIDRNTYGEWYEGATFFKYKGYKNGNMHFEFKDNKVWELFNQKVAKLLGYPLFEAKEQTAYQKRNTGRTQDTAPKSKKEFTILQTIKIA